MENIFDKIESQIHSSIKEQLKSANENSAEQNAFGASGTFDETIVTDNNGNWYREGEKQCYGVTVKFEGKLEVPEGVTVDLRGTSSDSKYDVINERNKKNGDPVQGRVPTEGWLNYTTFRGWVHTSKPNTKVRAYGRWWI